MELQTISYDQIINGFEPEGDKYGIAAYALSDLRKKAFLSNPYLSDTSKVMLKLVVDKGVVVGRSMEYQSKLKADDSIIDSIGGSALQVADDYRKSDAGMMLMAHNVERKENNVTIYSGFSRIAVKCHKAIGSKIMVFPQYIQIRDYRKYLLTTRLPSWLAMTAGCLINIAMKPFSILDAYTNKKKRKGFDIVRVDEVPHWVDDVVLNDGHKYMEVHDHKWLQWNLDNMFHAHPDNSNQFFVISKKEKIVGFFMIKERHDYLRNKYNLITGSVVEWGIKEPSLLDEHGIQCIALSFFSNKVDLAYLATTDDEVASHFRRPYFFRAGNAEVAVKDLKKQFKDFKDQSLWRLRLGYGDVILS